MKKRPVRNFALIAYLVVVGIAIYALERQTERQEGNIQVIERQLNVNPAQAFTPRQLCYVIKRGLESRAVRLKIDGKLVRPSVECVRLGLGGESEKGIPDTKFKLPPGLKGGDAEGPPPGGGG